MNITDSVDNPYNGIKLLNSTYTNKSTYTKLLRPTSYNMAKLADPIFSKIKLKKSLTIIIKFINNIIE